MNEAGVEIVAPMLEKLSPDTILEFLDARRRYLRAIRDKNNGANKARQIKPLSLVASVKTSIIQTICEMHLEIEEDELDDELLKCTLEKMSGCMRNSGDHQMSFVFADIQMDKSIGSAELRVADLWSQWYEAREKYNVKNQFKEKKGKKIFRREMTKRLWPESLRWQVDDALNGITEEDMLIRQNDKMFYDYCIDRAVEVDKSFRSAQRRRRQRAEEDRQVHEPNKKKRKSSGRQDRGGQKRNGRKCLKCQRTNHTVRQCRYIKDEQEAQDLIKKYRESSRSTERLGNVVDKSNSTVDKHVDCWIAGAASFPALLDSGASRTILSRKFLEAVKSKGIEVEETEIPQVRLELATTEHAVMSVVEVTLDLELETQVARTTLRQVPCLVVEQEMRYVFIGDRELRILGLHPVDNFNKRMSDQSVNEPLSYLSKLLTSIERNADKSSDKDKNSCSAVRLSGRKRANVGQTNADNTKRAKDMARVDTIGAGGSDQIPDSDSQSGAQHEANDGGRIMALYTERGRMSNLGSSQMSSTTILEQSSKNVSDQKIQDALRAMLDAARQQSVKKETIDELEALVYEFKDIWRVELGRDGPARVTPLKLRLKSNARPRRCRARRYPPKHRAFMHEMTKSLIAGDCIYANPQSRWSSPAYCVPKPHKPSALRMTIDLRYPNSQLVKIAGTMPILEVVLQHLQGAEFFSTLDAFKGYWQFPLDPQTAEVLSFMTDRGVFTPKRLIQGCTDSVFMFQAGMQEAMGDLLYECVLIWLDDLLQYARSEAELIANLRNIFEKCRSFNIKLSPEKTQLISREVVWVGRKISKEGINFDPEMTRGLVDLTPPKNAQQLQKFVCGANWMRNSIPSFAEAIEPLQSVLKSCQREAGSAKGTRLRKIPLEWSEQMDDAFRNVKKLLENAVRLAHPDFDKQFCLFTDASDLHWGVVLTQVTWIDEQECITKQSHEPLSFLSGSFSGSQLNWSIIEKEAFPIIAAVDRLRHYLLNDKGFRLYTDHRNLVYVFDPISRGSDCTKQTSEKLARWAEKLRAHTYTVEHLPGESNVWADILSRWKDKGDSVQSQSAERLASMMSSMPVKPDMEDFVWPSEEEIHKAQSKSMKEMGPKEVPNGVKYNCQRKTYTIKRFRSSEERIWIPDKNVDLQLRILVIAHTAGGGHRGIETTLRNVKKYFQWKQMAQDVKTFCRTCLHCTVNQNEVIPRPLAETLHATKPNQVLHYDFLYIGKMDPENIYVLVLKDDFSNFVELVPCKKADHFAVVDALLDWYKRFGVVKTHVSDNASHFKEKVIKELNRELGTTHRFTLAYAPWTNGTVEVVNSVLLDTLRALCSEMKVAFRDWVSLLPMVQGVINHTPSVRLSDKAPVTVMTGLEPSSPLDCIFVKRKDVLRKTRVTEMELRKTVTRLRESLHDIHKKVNEKKTQLRRSQRRSRNKVRQKAMKKIDLALGNYVMLAVPSKTRRNKLQPKWTGPWTITEVMSDHVYKLKHPLTKKVKIAHACRISRYEDIKLNKAVENQMWHDGGKHTFRVEKIVDSRENEDGSESFLIKWVGFEESDNSWEPADVMMEDIPELVRKFRKTRRG